MPRLTVIAGVDEGKVFELIGQSATIGRDSASDVRLFDTEVSRHHIQLEPRSDGGYRIIDLGSANGIRVNDQPAKSSDLKPGDRIQLGATTLLFSGGPGEPGKPDPLEKVRLVNRGGADWPSSIFKRIDDVAGSHLFGAADNRSDWLRARLGNLNILYEAIHAASHILDIDQLLDRILELLFQSVEADRGCFLLRDANGRLTTQAVRWRDGAGPRDELALSQTIIDHVLETRQGVLIADAAHDERFSAGASIVRYGIREAICVPLTGRHESIGILYFDTLRPAKPTDAVDVGRFSEEHLSLAVAVGRQAAIAIEETRHYQSLVQSERLAAVGQAIAALSHHIKNILQGLKTGGEALKLGIAEHDDNAVRAGWRLFEKNQQRIYDLVSDMLSYSKEREPNLQPTDITQLTHDVIDLVKPLATDRGITLTTRIGAIEKTLLDSEGIHRAILNLLNNAIDAVGESSEPSVDVSVSVEGDWLMIRVSDNGCGIEPEIQETLFQPFVSSKGSGGTGLGLAVSRKIAREHGGEIDVSTEPEKGSCFTIRLPYAMVK